MSVLTRVKGVIFSVFHLGKRTGIFKLCSGSLVFTLPSFVVVLHEDMEVYHQPGFAKGRNSPMSTLVNVPCCMEERSPLAFC